MTNIPLTVPVKVSVQDLTYKVNVSTAIQVVRADPYEGDYTVTPSLSEQVLETNGKVMENDVIVHAMKKGLATLPIMSFVADPNISFDKTTGKITATVSGNEEITPQVEEGYISEGTPGKIGYFGNKTLKLDGLSGGTIRPRLYGDYTVRKYYYLTGDYVFKSVTIDGLTADKVVEGNVVRIGDELDPEHIMRVEGTAVVPSGTKQVAITKNGTVTEDVTRYENAEITTNVPASEVDKGTKSIATNGTHNVVGYANAQVAVPASEVDVGTKEITSNGTHDVVGYASASVAVPASAVDSGTKSITSNGTHDVIGYASASVAVPNSYSQSDEGKVVSNGALVSQTSDTVTANDTYDTTLIDELTVNVPTGGGGITADEIAMESAPTGAVTLSTATEIKPFAFYGKPITSIYAPNVVKMDGRAFEKTNIVNLDDPFPAMVPSTSTLPNTTSGYLFGNMTSLKRVYMTNTGSFCARLDTFRGCTELVVLRLPNQNGGTDQRAAMGCTKLKVVDWGMSSVWKNMFNGCTLFDTLILRNSSIQSLGDVNVFTNTPFRGYSGRSGTVYVPSALIESYKTATNWSTIFAEGYCTFAALEGSPYEQIDWDDSALWQ